MSAVGTTHSNLQIGSHLGDHRNLIPVRIKIPFDALQASRMDQDNPGLFRKNTPLHQVFQC